MLQLIKIMHNSYTCIVSRNGELIFISLHNIKWYIIIKPKKKSRSPISSPCRSWFRRKHKNALALIIRVILVNAIRVLRANFLVIVLVAWEMTRAKN